MSVFEETFKDGYIKYHTNPVVPNSLDPRVFYFPPEGGDPTLNPMIKNQILMDISTINTAEGDHGTTRITDYILVGPILKQGCSDTCPLIIKVLISTSNLSDMLKEKILEIIKRINGDPNDKNNKTATYAAGTQHPIVYLPTIRPFDYSEFDAAYHPYTDKWEKKPRFLGEAVKSLAGLSKDPVKKKRKHSLTRSQLRPRLRQTKD